MSADHKEKLRRLRYGAVKTVIRMRWHTTIPDDDAGRPDLFALMALASLAPAGADKKMRNHLALWAPWMEAWEVEAYIDDLNLRPLYQRDLNGRQLGALMHLSNADRERWRVWNISPFDKTGEDLAEQSKARVAQRRRERARLKGVVSRAEYLASVWKPKPWEVEGIHRSTWFRRKAREEMRLGSAQIIVLKPEHNLVASVPAESPRRGFRGGAGAEGRAIQVTEVGEVERYQPGSHGLDHNLVAPSEEQRWTEGTALLLLAREFAKSDPHLSWAMCGAFVSRFGPEAAERVAA